MQEYHIGQLYQNVRTSYIIDKMEQEATNATSSNKQQGAMQSNKWQTNFAAC